MRRVMGIAGVVVVVALVIGGFVVVDGWFRAGRDPEAPWRTPDIVLAGPEHWSFLLPGALLVTAIVAVGATVAVRTDGLGRVSRRALSQSPAGGTIYRATRLLAVAPAVGSVCSVGVAVALAPQANGFAAGLAGLGAAVWHAHGVVFGARVVVRHGTLVVDNPRFRYVVPLGAVEAIACTGTETEVRVAAGGVIPIVAARQRRLADAERQARRIVALADAQPDRAAGSVTRVRNWSYLFIEVGAAAALVAGLCWLAVAG